MNTKIFMTLCCFLLLSACSTRKSVEKAAPTKEPTPGWNYDQVRKARAAEQDQESVRPAPSGPEVTLDCVIMNEVQKTQARASGCRKLDPRLGHGEDAYCCER